MPHAPRRLPARLSAVLAFSLGVSAPAFAQQVDHPTDHERAVSRFQEGTKLVEQGDCAGAIPKFQESLKTEEGVGAHLNLADCYDRIGSTEKAWLEFKDTERFAALKGNDERVEVAHAAAYNLEKKLLKLTLIVPAVDGLDVSINGHKIDRTLLASGLIAVTPGAYVIDARAVGKKAFHTEGSGDAGQLQRVVIAFADEAAVAPPPQTPKAPAESRGSPQRTIGVIVAGAGLASVAVGSVFGLVAIGDKSELSTVFSARCTGTYPTGTCPTTAHGELDPLKSKLSSAATASTIFLVAGGVAVAAGAVLYFTAPKKSAEAAMRLAPLVGTREAGMAFAGGW